MTGPTGTSFTTAPASLRALLAGLIDYAGLYPPAGLGMPEAASEFAVRRTGPDAWVLGRFVVAASRLDELGAAIEGPGLMGGRPWPVSALLGADPASDVESIRAIEGRGIVRVDSLEFKATTISEIDRTLAIVGAPRECYVEIPLTPDPSALLTEVAERGLRAKARTGGVTQALFPALGDVIRFFEICGRLDLAFKLTAGLHHPLEGEYRLTYQPDTAHGMMFGFLTMFAAAAAARQHWPLNQVAGLIAEQDASALRFDDAGMHWKGRLLSTDSLAEGRARGALSFGSCSFAEPLTELREIGYLPA